MAKVDGLDEDWSGSLTGDTESVREPPEPNVVDRESAREFIQRWTSAGPALLAQRYRWLQSLDDEMARHMTLDLFELWRPSEFDEMGASLVEAQKVFIELARSEAVFARTKVR